MQIGDHVKNRIIDRYLGPIERFGNIGKMPVAVVDGSTFALADLAPADWRARWVEPSIAELRRWVRDALGTPSEVYAVQALAARLQRK